jgi:hypothetical protein
VRKRFYTALACTVVISTCGCGHTKSGAPASTKRIGAGVSVTSTRIPRRLRASTSRREKLPYSRAVRLSRFFRITPHKRLSAPLTLRLPLLRPAPKKFLVLAAVRETRTGAWRPLRPRLVGHRRFAVLRVRRLSWFVLFGIDIGEVLRDFKREIIDGLAADATAEARPPTCSGESSARSDGYSITSSTKNTVFWCFGIDGGRRVLKVVNNRRYPLAVTHPSLSVVDAGPVHIADLSSLSRTVSGRYTIIFPRDEATFGFDLRPGKAGRVQTEYDSVGQSLYQLQEGLSLAGTLIGAAVESGAAERTAAVKAMDAVLHSRECVSAIGGTPGEIIQRCLTSQSMLKVYGPKGVLVSWIMTATKVYAFFRSEWNAFFDQLNHRDAYTILIQRASTPPPPQPPPTQPPPAPTTSAPASGPSYSVGSIFEDDCQVAWPTAPTRTTTDIEMHMECVHLPSSYLLAIVVYPDPNLKMTPSTGRVHVHGRIVDIAKSDYGFRELVVQADRIELPSGG